MLNLLKRQLSANSKPTLRERFSAMKAPPLAHDADKGRRTLLAGLAVPVVASLPVATPVLAAPPSDLARACVWAVGQTAFINGTAHREEWDDDRLNAEVDKVVDVIARATREPSASLADTAAKARLALREFLDSELPLTTMTEADLDDSSRLVVVVLREMIAMGGRA